MSEEDDPYPWLDKVDPRRNMTDRESLEKFVDLSDSDITETEKKNLYKLLYKYKKSFSLRDKIGLCQSMEVELELKDESPFFIRPFPIARFFHLFLWLYILYCAVLGKVVRVYP